MMTTVIPNQGSDVAPTTPRAEAVTPAAEPVEAHHHGYINDKDRFLARLKRIEGQARGIHRMIDEEQYCIDILTQITALTSALRNVGLGLLDDHMRHCVTDAALQGGEEAEAKFKEVSDAIARFTR